MQNNNDNSKEEVKKLENLKEEENFIEDEDSEEDIYLIELHKRLYNMKRERKKVEEDENLLINRINLLKGEETKVFQAK